MRRAFKADDGNAHHQRLARGGRAVVREGVERNVDPVVHREVIGFYFLLAQQFDTLDRRAG